MPTDAAERLFALTTPLGEGAFGMTAFSGREELSRPFAFAIDLQSDDPAIDPTGLVGKPVGWAVNYPDEAPRYFHGFVRRLTAGRITSGVRAYRAEVVPWLWFLTRTADCRVFQAKTAPDIIKDVFGLFGFSDYKLSLQATYTTREYTVQYRETAFDFVSRLMEEEGIYYYFTFADGSHTLVLADKPAAYYACDPHGTVEFRTDVPKAEVVSGWDRAYAYQSGKCTHTDYNFETPSTNLLAKAPTTLGLTDQGKFEVFDYPGRYGVSGDGTNLAKVRIEACEAGYDTAEGASRCSSFAAGGKFTLTGHPGDDGEYVLVSVDHTATDGGDEYSNTFTAIPAAVPFRPARVTPTGLVQGPQPALVVGPSGEEIYTDKYGRVKVQFYWDRVGTKNENSSCWLRVAEMWAGKNWGMVFTPRIGQEVIVDFLEGDPDRPFVSGRVYNAEQMPPWALPANMTQSGVKTRSSKGGGEADFNELRFEDKKGEEDIYFHAQKDFHRYVENDDDLQVLHDQTITVKNNRTEEVTEGNETITIKKGNRTEEVTEGNETVTVKKGDRLVTVETGNDTHVVKTGNRVVTVETGNDTHTVKTGNREVSVDTGNDTLTVKTGNIAIKASAGAITVEAAQSITLKVGANSVVIDTSGVTIKGTNVKIEATAAAEVKGLNVTAEASVAASVKGLTTTVEASGPMTVKGAIVAIN